jgi:hypothetical protein
MKRTDAFGYDRCCFTLSCTLASYVSEATFFEAPFPSSKWFALTQRGLAQIIPVSISRLSVMNHTPVPLSFMMFSGVIFSSSGTVNVILWLVTRQSYIVREARRIT